MARCGGARAGRVLARVSRALLVVPLALLLTPGSASAASHRPRNARAERPAVTVSDVSVTEPAAGRSVLATFTISLSATPAHLMFLPVHTQDGTATARSGDYFPVRRVVAFKAGGPTSKTVGVRVRADNVTEGPETFSLVVGPGMTQRSRSRFPSVVGTATILPPAAPTPPPVVPPAQSLAVTMTGTSVPEPHSGGLSDGVVTIAPVTPPDHDIVLNYTLVGVDATPNADFLPATGTVTLAAGSSAAQSVIVTVVGDDTPEPDETFQVVFSVADNSASLTPTPYATVTILDNTTNGPVIDPQ